MTKFPKKLKIEIVLVLILFAASYMFPFCTFYYLGENEADKIAVPQYVTKFKFGYVYIAYFLMVLFAVFSAKKAVLKTINILVLILLLLSFLMTSMGFAFWGVSPYHPTFHIAFYLVNISSLYAIVRSYSWINTFIAFPVRSNLALIVAISIPVVFLMFIYYYYKKTINKPQMITRSFVEIKNNRIVRSQCWEYIDAHEAFATKYFSKPVTDSMKNTYVLDSVNFSFTDNSPNKGKEFTIRAKNGKLDIDEILDDY